MSDNHPAREMLANSVIQLCQGGNSHYRQKADELGISLNFLFRATRCVYGDPTGTAYGPVLSDNLVRTLDACGLQIGPAETSKIGAFAEACRLVRVHVKPRQKAEMLVRVMQAIEGSPARESWSE